MGLSVTYRQRHPERTPFYQCLEDYWEEFKESYRNFYERDYGSLRPVVDKTVDRFSECGIFRHGFARIRCPECRQEYLLAFSCKTRYFCPSCQAQRVAAFVEWITGEILQEVPHRQLVWTIPKVLRPTFRRDRKLLGELSRAAWRSLCQYFGHALGCDSVPAAIFAIQTYGDQLNWHPHLHSLLADGAWGKSNGAFQPIAWLDADILSSAFRQQVLAMMVSKRRLSAEFAQNISNWRHSGFQVHCGPPVEADHPQALERLAAYILRPSFASTRVRYLAGSGQVQYRTAKGVARSMDALDWIAQVVSHIPDPGEQMVRYYGWYSNASRGKRRKPGVSVPVEAQVQDTPQPDSDGEHFAQRRRSWARLLKKIYEVDPLRCPHCGSEMQIIAWIEQSEVIRKILRHLDLWERPQRSPPPKLFPHKLETFMASLSPRQAQEIRASTDSVFWDDVPVWNG